MFRPLQLKASFHIVTYSRIGHVTIRPLRVLARIIVPQLSAFSFRSNGFCHCRRYGRGLLRNAKIHRCDGNYSDLTFVKDLSKRRLANIRPYKLSLPFPSNLLPNNSNQSRFRLLAGHGKRICMIFTFNQLRCLSNHDGPRQECHKFACLTMNSTEFCTSNFHILHHDFAAVLVLSATRND